jgi:amino acid adenylation domain-containing protein
MSPGESGMHPFRLGQDEGALDSVAALAARIWAEVIGVRAIGPHDNIFDFGVGSITAARVVARLREEFGVALPLRALFEHPTIAELVPHLRQAEPADEAPGPAHAGSGRSLPSFDQERLWFLDQLQPGSAAYNIPVVASVAGPLDVGVLQRCLDELVRRHEALRMVFHVVDGRPVIQVTPPGRVALPVVDARAPSPAAARERAHAYAEEEAKTPFDMERGPLLRARLVQLGEQEYQLLLTVHHVVADGWSLDLVFSELELLYPAFAAGRRSPLPELELQYADWAGWQRDRLRGECLDDLLSWWRQRLAGVPPVLELPSGHPRPAIRSGHGSQCCFELPPSLSAALTSFAQGESATLFMVLLAGFSALLHRYTGHIDMVVGTPVANRGRREVERLVGLFVQTVPLRCDLSGRPTFRQLVGRVRETALDAFAHQELPFGKLVEALRPERSLAYNPLVQVVFALQNTAAATGAGGAGGRFRRDGGGASASGTAKFDLTLYMREDGDRIRGLWEYDTDLYEPDRIERMGGHLVTLLEAAISDPDRGIDVLALSDVTERARLARPPASTKLGGRASTLPQLFAAAVSRFGARTAVADGTRSLTYDELNKAANRLAHRLRKLGVGPETLVGVCADRDADLVVALLAILKASGGYVPLDPAYPPERLRFTLADAGCRIVLGQDRFGDLFAGYGGSFLALDADAGLVDEPDDDPGLDVRPGHAAYVIYTSGSTGRPKGVVVSHANVTRLFDVTAPGFRFGPDDSWTLFHSFGFDFSVWELWGALLHGGRVVVVPLSTCRDPEAFLRLLITERVTVLSQTPSAFRQLAAAAESAGFPATSLRLVVFGGEALDPPALRTWFEHYGDVRPRLVNMYGITETTVHVTERPLERADAGLAESPIGRPLPDLSVYLLDPRLEPVACGVIGEMYVGGAGVSRGYLGRPGLSAGRFCPDPFGRPGSRMYRTGDLAFRQANGELVFCGRADSQVQLRGFRIELGEVEHALLDQPLVREAAVVLREGAGGDQCLVGYVVAAPGADVSSGELRAGLSRRLPAHMVPAVFVTLDRFPLTANGKLDRARLPEPPAMHTVVASDYVAPRTPVEQRVAGIWSEVLGVDPIGVHHNFFELGGHSLLAPRLTARIRDTFGLSLPTRLVFERPTVAELAAAIAAGPGREGSAGGNGNVEPAQTAAASSADGWLLGHRPSARAQVRLLCFPYAGGAASLFHGWQARLPAEVDLCAVQLPGRQTRLAEPPFVELQPLVDAVGTALQPLADLPWVLFGHSFGGLVAFELACLLANRGQPPAFLFVSALRPPHLLTPREADQQRSDGELLAKLRQPDGIPGEVVTRQDLVDLALPAFRADLSILDGYAFTPTSPLDVPLSVFGGAQDAHPAPAELSAWQRHTRGPFRARVLPGGHFFLEDQYPALCAALMGDLRERGLIKP